MPELPDVYWIINRIKKGVIDQVIKGIEIFSPGPIQLPLKEFKKGLLGRKIGI